MQLRIRSAFTLIVLLSAAAVFALPGGIFVGGFEHGPTGGATLSVAATRRVRVGNLGSSGQDGVEVKLFTAWGGGGAIDLTPMLPTPSSVRASYKGWDGTIKGNVDLVSLGSGSFTLNADFTPIGAPVMLYSLYDSARNLVGQGVLPPGGLGIAMPFVCPDGNPPIWQPIGHIAENGLYYVTMELACDCEINNGTGSTALCRSITLTPDLPGGIPFNGIDTVIFTASGLSSMDILDASIGTFGAQCWAEGDAHLTEACDNPLGCTQAERRLKVSNIGSSGQDGVSVDLRNIGLYTGNVSGQGTVTLQTSSVAAPGSTSVAGSLECSKHTKTGHVTLLKRTINPNPATGLDDVAIDFSPIGAATCDVYFLDDAGLLLGEIEMLNNDPLFIPPGSSDDNLVIDSHSIQARKGSLTIVSLPGGMMFSNVRTIRYVPKNIGINELIPDTLTLHSNAGELSLDLVRSAPTLTIRGLDFSATGSAKLTKADAGRALVSNIGSSDQDGVSVSTFSKIGGGASIDLTPMLDASGLAREIKIRHKGWDGTIKGRLSTNSTPTGALTQTCEMSTANPPIKIRAWIKDAYDRVMWTGDIPGSTLTWSLAVTSPPGSTPECKVTTSRPPTADRRLTRVEYLGCDALVTGFSTTPLSGVATIELVPTDPDTDDDGIDSLLVTCTGLSECIVGNPSLQTYEAECAGVGDVSIAETDDSTGLRKLVASNIGSSGQDGVEINLRAIGAQSHEDSDPPLGRVITFTTSTVDYPSGTRITEECRKHTKTGHVTLLKRTSNPDAAGRSVSVDFSGDNSPGCILYLIGASGSLLGQVPLDNNIPISMPACTTGADILTLDGFALEVQPCDGPTTIIAGGAFYPGVARLRYARIGYEIMVPDTLIIQSNAQLMTIDTLSVQRSLNVSGLPHLPLGTATLGNTVGRRLPVSNIGSSGQDGVEVDLHSVTGGGIAVDLAPMLSATGVAREIRVRPKGWDGTIKGRMSLFSSPTGALSEMYDFSDVGAPSLHWQLMDAAGATLAQGTSPGPVLVFGLDAAAAPGETVKKRFSVSGSGSARSADQGFFDRVVTVSGLTPSPVSGVQAIQVDPDPCAGLPENCPPWLNAQSLLVTASGISAIDILDSHLGTFDVECSGAGQAAIWEKVDNSGASARQLAVQNIGSSGQDGVSIDIGPNANNVTVARKKDYCCPGHITLMKITDEADQELVRVTSSSNPATGEPTVTFDFSTLGAAQFDFYVYDSAHILQSVTTYDNNAPIVESCTFTDSRRITCDDGYHVSISCGNPALATTGVAIPRVPQIPCAIPRHITITAEGDELDTGFTIEDVTVRRRAPADMNCDGAVDLSDAALFVHGILNPASFTGCALSNGDINRDGRVDGDDLQGFVNLLIHP